MEDQNPKNRGKIGKVIILSISISLIPILVVASLFLLNQTRKIQKDITLKKEILDEQNILISNIEIENENLLSEMELYNNIDEKLPEVKDTYYKTLKTFEDQVLAGKVKYKIAYLTFDDGPYYNTYNFFNVLEKYDVLATFFTTDVNGTHCYDNYNYNCQKLYPEYVKRGHTIANHTYTHDIWGTRGTPYGGVYGSVQAFMWNISEQEKLVKNLTNGYVTNITRFPGGSATAGYLKDGIVAELRKKGYGYVDWTAQDGDGGSVSDTTTAWNNFIGSFKNGKTEVVLFHDYSSITLSILPKVIEHLQNNNYVLLPLFYESSVINK